MEMGGGGGFCCFVIVFHRVRRQQTGTTSFCLELSFNIHLSISRHSPMSVAKSLSSHQQIKGACPTGASLFPDGMSSFHVCQFDRKHMCHEAIDLCRRLRRNIHRDQNFQNPLNIWLHSRNIRTGNQHSARGSVRGWLHFV